MAKVKGKALSDPEKPTDASEDIGPMTMLHNTIRMQIDLTTAMEMALGQARDRREYVEAQLIFATKLFQQWGMPYDGLWDLFLALRDARVGVKDPLIQVTPIGGSSLPTRIYMLRATCVAAAEARQKCEDCSGPKARRAFVGDLSDEERRSIFPERGDEVECNIDDIERCVESLDTWTKGFRTGKRTGPAAPGGKRMAEIAYIRMREIIEEAGSTDELEKIYQGLLLRAKQLTNASVSE